MSTAVTFATLIGFCFYSVCSGRARIVADDISANIKHKMTKEQKKVRANSIPVAAAPLSAMTILCVQELSPRSHRAGCHFGGARGASRGLEGQAQQEGRRDHQLGEAEEQAVSSAAVAHVVLS